MLFGCLAGYITLGRIEIVGHVDHFSLRTPRDLLAKLEHDYARLLAAAPASREAQFAAFDFFVCAEHLPDWLFPNRKTEASALRGRYGDGALVSHIANGAKHFELRPHHRSLAKAGITDPAFQVGAFQSGAFQTEGSLFVETTSRTQEDVLSLAKRVIEYWRTAV